MPQAKLSNIMKIHSMFNTMKTVAAFAIPVSAGGIINMISSFIAMMMVAELGPAPLAAGALAITTFITVMTVTATIFYAVGILISHHKGKNKTNAEIGYVVKNGMFLAILLAFPSALILWHADTLLIMFGQDQSLILLTHDYFHYSALSLFPLLINSVIAQFFAGTGRPKITMLIAVLGLPVTIFLSYVFILGRFGFPVMELGGVAFANLISQSIGVVFVLLWMYFTDKKYQLIARPFLPSVQICKAIFNLGFPIGIQFGGEIAAMSVATYMMGFFGVNALAASQVVSQYALFVLMISVGLTQALSILISKAYGQNDIRLVKEYLYASMSLLCLCFVIVGILFCLYPKQLILFYVNKHALNGEITYLASHFFTIAAFLLFVDGMRNLFSGALRGLHDSRAPMRIGVISLWLISIPASYFVTFKMQGTPIDLRLAFTSGFVIAAIILWRRLRFAIRNSSVCK